METGRIHLWQERAGLLAGFGVEDVKIIIECGDNLRDLPGGVCNGGNALHHLHEAARIAYEAANAE